MMDIKEVLPQCLINVLIKKKKRLLRLHGQRRQLRELHEIYNSNFKIGVIVRISKYKNTFAKGYVPNWSEDVFVITKVRNTVPKAYVISDLKGE